jgi:hypothetical protein
VKFDTHAFFDYSSGIVKLRRTMKDELLNEYAELMTPLLPLAKKAYGSRATASPQHDASREYTRLLVEFYSKGGSLLQLAEHLSVTYAGIRRRIITAEIPAMPKGKSSKATGDMITRRAETLKAIQATGDTERYHEAIYHMYAVENISLAKIAKAMGLSSANPLYYAVAKIKILKNQDV